MYKLLERTLFYPESDSQGNLSGQKEIMLEGSLLDIVQVLPHRALMKHVSEMGAVTYGWCAARNLQRVDDLIGTSLTYLETDFREVGGTIVDIDKSERRYRVKWDDSHRISWVCADSPAVISPLPENLS